MCDIYNLLPEGKENAVNVKYLISATGAESRRELNHRIRAERLNGALILSTKANGGGYYRPKDAAEIREFVKSYSGEAKALFTMLRTSRQAIKKFDAESERRHNER